MEGLLIVTIQILMFGKSLDGYLVLLNGGESITLEENMNFAQSLPNNMGINVFMMLAVN